MIGKEINSDTLILDEIQACIEYLKILLIQIENEIIQIEVKTDENVKSRCLSLFNEKIDPILRIRYSLKNLQYREGC